MIHSNIIITIERLNEQAIPLERKQMLEELRSYIQEKKDTGQPIRLNFICTHNSRRSHFAQVWAQTLADYYQIPKLQSFSGGTQATALFPMVADSLERQGFEVLRLSKEENPVYAITFNSQTAPIIGFSKVHSHPFNPKRDFAAIMTCDAADQDCPFIVGAEKRIPITFNDPKISDGTPNATATYLARSEEIAAALNHVFSQIH